MKYYQEITILPDPEIDMYFIWQKLYTQIHLALVEHAKASYGDGATYGDIGVSFPEYAFQKKVKDKLVTTLGKKLRVFANTKDDFKTLKLDKWLENLTDYVHIKSVQAVPSEHSYICICRARQIKNLDQVTKRRCKRKGESFEQAKSNIIERYAKEYGISRDEAEKAYHHPKLTAYPYITMQSLHGKRTFSLEVKQVKQAEKVLGQFNTYGLSAKTTVPHW